MRILILRPGAIGDTLLTFPIIQALRACYASVHITLVGNAAVLPLASASGLVDVTSNYEDPQWSELFHPSGVRMPALRTLVRQTDLAICWLRDPDGLIARNMRALGVPDVIIAPGRPAEGEQIHIVAYLARTLGLSPDDVPDPSQAVIDIPRLQGARPSLPAVAIHPGSGGARKCWPIAHFAAVITALHQLHIPVLLLSGPADHERIAGLQHLLHPFPALLADAPLLEVAQQLQQCRLFLGNDAGITHLAAQSGVPTIVLFGPSSPRVWSPYGPAVTILHVPIMENLQIRTVLDTIETYIF